MKKIFGLIVFAALIVTVGCTSEVTNKELDPSMPAVQEGRIIEINSRILVVSDITKEEALELTQNELLGEGSPGREAVWYTVKRPARYKVGMLVRVQTELMMDSYPGQATAERVQIVEE